VLHAYQPDCVTDPLQSELLAEWCYISNSKVIIISGYTNSPLQLRKRKYLINYALAIKLATKQKGLYQSYLKLLMCYLLDHRLHAEAE